jgi:hypothetical protein
MKHNCTTNQIKYYNGNLYTKYKREDGLTEWCTICGRICDTIPVPTLIHGRMEMVHTHRHRKLGPYDGPKTEIADVSGNPSHSGIEKDCIAFGGGGYNEKIARYRALRNYVFNVLNKPDKIGKITFEQAMNELVEVAWNAPLTDMNAAKTIREKTNNALGNRWNMPSSGFPKPAELEKILQTIENIGEKSNNYVYPDIEWPFKGIPNMMPIISSSGENAIAMDDASGVIQFIHRQKDGSRKVHEQLVGYKTFFSSLPTENTEENFSQCIFGINECTGIHYPGELYYILKNIYKYDPTITKE